MQEIMEFINSFSKGGRRVSDLSRFAALMEVLGNPQDSLRCIHIAGTNGKGSTTRFCGAVLMEAGYKVGEFTSPFMVEYSDRIRINGENIPAEKIEEYGRRVREAVGENHGYSQFEITAAIAFLHFRAENCDAVALETGLGGLLDCTNIIKSPLLSIITSISLDHTKILGKTLEEIAVQKAGIIKKGCPVLLAAGNCPAVFDIVESIAAEKNAPVILPVMQDLGVVNVSIFGNEFTYRGEKYTTKMGGEHQIFNALSAIEAVICLRKKGFAIDEKALTAGLSTAAVPARGEVVSRKNEPLILLDGAHNPGAVAALAGLVTAEIPTESITWVVGMLGEKEVSAMILEFKKHCSGGRFLCVDGFAEGAVDAKNLAERFCSVGIDASACSDFRELFLRGGCPNGVVTVVCGSLYLAAEVRKLLL